MSPRLPAEFESTEKVWVSPVLKQESWPGGNLHDRALQQHADMCHAIAQHVPVDTPQNHGIPTDDVWMRDFGPIFTIDHEGGLTAHDFVFNCWGGKYDAYDQDDAVPTRLAQTLGWNLQQHDTVLEGGGIETDGQGNALLGAHCLTHHNRGGSNRAEWETLLFETLGLHHCIWLPGALAGDDTDGHIDTLARFIAPGVVAAPLTDAGHPDRDTLHANWRVLEQARLADGSALQLVRLPVPEKLQHFTFPPSRWNAEPLEELLPLSYANFLMVGKENGGGASGGGGAVFVPVFGDRMDDVACRALEAALGGWSVVPVMSDVLAVGLGAVHCMTMQQPRVASSVTR